MADSMERIIERYERCSYAEKKQAVDSEPKENWSIEYPKLVARIELLQRNMSNYMGEDLDPLSLRELRSLEQQLDTALKRIRTRKNQLMHESILQLQKKERSLQGQNNLLAKKLKENEKNQIEEVQEAQGKPDQNVAQTSKTFMLPQHTPELHTVLPSLNIGDESRHPIGVEEDSNQIRTANSNAALIPPWLLRHVNH